MIIRLFSGESQENLETSKKIYTPEVNDTEKLASDEDDEPISEKLRNQEPKAEKDIRQRYTKWRRNRMPSKLKIKPTTKGKNWIKITKKKNIFSMLRIQLPDYDEEKWVKLLYIKIKEFTRNKTWSMFKFHIEDPLITVTERVNIGDMLNFLLQIKFKKYTFFLCERPDKQLNEGEKLNLLRKSHRNVATGHFRENKPIKRLREQTSWENMEKDAIDFIKKCQVCQQQKLTRIQLKV